MLCITYHIAYVGVHNHTKNILQGKGFGDITCTDETWTFTYTILAHLSGSGSGSNGSVNRTVNKLGAGGNGANALRMFVQDLRGVATIRELHSTIEKSTLLFR